MTDYPSSQMHLALALLLAVAPPTPAGPWRAALDLAGGELRFALHLTGGPGRWNGRLCNGQECQRFTAVRQAGDSLVLELGDYAATITARFTGDSLTGQY